MKNQRGITLIALIITIVVMMILVGVTVSFTIGENGIISQAKQAMTKQESATIKDRIALEMVACYDYQNGDLKLNMGKLSKNLEKNFEQEILKGEIAIAEISDNDDYVALINRINEVNNTNFPTTDLSEIQNFLDGYAKLEEWSLANIEELTDDLIKGKMQEIGMYEYYPEGSLPETKYTGILDIDIRDAMKNILEEGIIWIGYKENSYEINSEGDITDTTDSSGFAFATGMVANVSGESVNSIIGYTGNCPSKVVINDSNIKLIKTGAFKNCLNLQELVIENSTMEIQEKAFENCLNLKSVTINLSGLLTGGFSCLETSFYECNNLEEVNIIGISQEDFETYQLEDSIKSVFPGATINVIEE